jgi:hypothetical protein
MLLFEVVGKAFKAAPEQIAATCVNVGVTIGLTTIVTSFDVAGDPTKHGVAFDVITQVITSPLTSEVEVYVEAAAPEIVVPFFFHIYVGETPPFVGVAVNVTEAPAQTVVALAAIETLAVRIGLTVIVMVAVEAHCPAVGVNV